MIDLPAETTPREVVVSWAYGLLGLYRPEHADLWPEAAELFPPPAAPYQAAPQAPFGDEQPRTVTKRAMVGLSPQPPSDPPAAKFGGHPDWLSQPQWPLEPDGRPMTFYGQLPLPEHSGQIAYLFIGSRDNWQPLSDGNAVVVQPASTCHRPTVATARGPRLYERVHELDGFVQFSYARAYERFVELRDAADPASWQPDQDTMVEDWNKIGGTPRFLQDEQWPPGDGWRFAAQFTAGWAGRELADGAECYIFVRDDLNAAFLWQCH